MNDKITIEDIAQDLHVSKSTISRALSGKGRISEATRQRVMAYCEEHSYKPNLIARSLAKSKTYNIAVVLPNDHDLDDIPFFQNCLLGICMEAAQREYDALVITADKMNIAPLERLIQNHKVDGVILTRALENDPKVHFLQEQHVPFLVIGSMEEADILQVDSPHAEACSELVSMLIMQGMKRLSYIGDAPDYVVNERRLQGFREGLAMNQIKEAQGLVHMDCMTRHDVDVAVETVLHRRTDCIVCMDDKICSYVLGKLQKENVRIPEGVRVASFYDSHILADNNPPITALRFNVREMGKTACALLLDYMDGRPVEYKASMDYDIILRASTKIMLP